MRQSRREESFFFLDFCGFLYLIAESSRHSNSLEISDRQKHSHNFFHSIHVELRLVGQRPPMDLAGFHIWWSDGFTSTFYNFRFCSTFLCAMHAFFTSMKFKKGNKPRSALRPQITRLGYTIKHCLQALPRIPPYSSMWSGDAWFFSVSQSNINGKFCHT